MHAEETGKVFNETMPEKIGREVGKLEQVLGNTNKEDYKIEEN